MDLNALIWLFLELVGICCIFGLALFIVSVLPATTEPYKGWLRIGLLILGAVLLMFWIAAVITGHGSPVFGRH